MFHGYQAHHVPNAPRCAIRLEEGPWPWFAPLLFLKKTMHVKFSWAGIAFNPQGNLQSHQSNRVIIPCCGTHRDELDLVFRVAMWVEGDSPFETTIVGKAEAGEVVQALGTA